MNMIDQPREEIKEIAGKTIKSAHFDWDSALNPFVEITFTDGSTFVVKETNQMGSISYYWLERP